MKLLFRKNFFSNMNFLKKVSHQDINELLAYLSSSLDGLSLDEIDERKKNNNVNILNKKKIIILLKS
ncbi:MAG: cation-transporting P-type ATPase [Pigeon pea little leaf phytoplasma]|nr:cation-transporting P-type ATPase [Pigeon pea little leaf phytoplasma]